MMKLSLVSYNLLVFRIYLVIFVRVDGMFYITVDQNLDTLTASPVAI